MTEEMRFYKKTKINASSENDQKLFIIVLVVLLICFFMTLISS